MNTRISAVCEFLFCRFEGADDFLIKPFAQVELNARVEAAVIRSRTRPRSILEIGPIVMNLTSRKMTYYGENIPLTPTEFRILEILSRNQGKTVTRRMLCEFLWNPDWEGVTNVIEVHINRLRTKLREQSQEQVIYTVRGSGYALRFDSQHSQHSRVGPELSAPHVAPTRAVPSEL